MEAKVREETARLKAELLAGGPVRLPESFRLPFKPSRSTAGPGAGSPEVVFSFEGTRAKKEVTRDRADFELVEMAGVLSIMRLGKPFIHQVELLPTLRHAPFQAFINIDNRCVFDCAFCSSTKLERDLSKHLTDDGIVEMIMEASRDETFESVALTSGVSGSPAETVHRIVRIVRRVRSELPETPIGVEPYVTEPRQVDAIKQVGADEIKINMVTFAPNFDGFEINVDGQGWKASPHEFVWKLKPSALNTLEMRVKNKLGPKGKPSQIQVMYHYKEPFSPRPKDW